MNFSCDGREKTIGHPVLFVKQGKVGLYIFIFGQTLFPLLLSIDSTPCGKNISVKTTKSQIEKEL